MPTLNLYEFAVAEARKSAGQRELQKVARETGLDYSWLQKFSRGKIPGASYERVVHLADHYLAAGSVPPKVGAEA